jgi:tRNA (mo5U34)-methyltransferase
VAGQDRLVTIPIPSERSRDEVQSALDQYTDWFYDFRFANGAEATVKSELVRAIRDTKPDLIFPHLDHLFRDRWGDVECLDMACHQGWFSVQTALRGAGRVHGVDVREEHVARASLISELAGLTNTSFEQRNLFELDPERDGRFDLTLFLGILYHLDDPVRSLRLAHALTKELCVVETQVARAAPELEYVWGSDVDVRKGYPIAVGRVGPRHVAEGTQMTLVPTLKALYYMLYAVGFKRLQLAIPPFTAYEQFTQFDRVVVFAAV